MKIAIILCVALLGVSGAVSVGLQGGIIGPQSLDVGFYAGGHLNAPNAFTNNLDLYVPVEIWMAGESHTYTRAGYIDEYTFHVTDISVTGQTRYHFTGPVGFFAGGGIGIHFITESYKHEYSAVHTDHDWDDSDTRLGLDACGGYTFGGTGVLISPELTFQFNGGYNAIKLGCGFTFG